LQRFGATVRAYDPVGMPNATRMLDDVALIDDPYECARNADAVVIVTEWDCIRRLDLEHLKQVMHAPVLVDLRNAVSQERAEAAGFRITMIGKPSRNHKDMHSAAPMMMQITDEQKGAGYVQK
jgi:UDPglucose 6-dehydrogenase